MKRILSVALAFSGWICVVNSSRVLAQQSNSHPQTTLYSSLKYPDEHRNACLDLLTGAPGSDSYYHRCDLRYGGLYVGNDLDWFASSGPPAVRSLVKDLGKLDWTSRFKVPVVDPLPKLKPGEQRHITFTTEQPLPSDSCCAFVGPGDDFSAPGPDLTPRKKPRPPIDPPVLVKAQLGHIYVIHVVDDVNDFYALFRVDAVERGDHCTISWRLIPAPEPKATRRK